MFLIRGALHRLLAVIYLIIGFVVASSHHYFAHLNAAKPLLSAVLAVALWPLLVFGVNLHIK
jgi:Mn2+/Fe2+ NRAMP family transporter